MGQIVKNGIRYSGTVGNAKETNFDNSVSGVDETNVQDIIDKNIEDISQLNQNLVNVRTYVGDDGKIHFTDSTGADSVLPFSGKPNVVTVGTGNTTAAKTFNIAAITSNFKSMQLGKDIFVHMVSSTTRGSSQDVNGTVSYSQETGILTIPKMSYYVGSSGHTLSLNYTVYALVYN